MTDNKRPTPDELRNTQDATFTTGEGKAPELGVKNASTEGSTYRPDWVPEEAKKDDTYACHVMKGVKEMHDGLYLVQLIWLQRYVPYSGERN